MHIKLNHSLNSSVSRKWTRKIGYVIYMTHNFQIASQQMRLKQIVGGERLVVEWIGELKLLYRNFRSNHP